MRKLKLLSSFWQMFRLMWMKFNIQPGLVDFLKVILNCFCTINLQGREPHLVDATKYTFNICFCLHANELISFKLGRMTDMTILCSLIAVSMTLTSN